jgi:hypothetical protein
MEVWTAGVAVTTAEFQLRQTSTCDDFIQRLLLEGTAHCGTSVINLTSSTCERVFLTWFTVNLVTSRNVVQHKYCKLEARPNSLS